MTTSAMIHNPPTTPPAIGPACDDLLSEEVPEIGVTGDIDAAGEVMTVFASVDIVAFPFRTAA